MREPCSARSFVFVTECQGEPPYMIRFAGYYDDQLVKVRAAHGFLRQRIIRLWDGEVLARFPGRGKRTPRKRPPELVIKTTCRSQLFCGSPNIPAAVRRRKTMTMHQMKRVSSSQHAWPLWLCLALAAQTPKPVRTQAGLVQGHDAKRHHHLQRHSVCRAARGRFALARAAAARRVERTCAQPTNSRRPACRFPS